jgi:FkbM family methyltransferase
MSFGSLFRGTINHALRPFKLELAKYRGGKLSAFSMEGGLARAQRRGIEVSTILDIGASDGKWSRLALKYFPQARVLAFEPLAERKAALEAFKAHDARFDYLSAVAGDRAGEIAFHVSQDLDGSGVSPTRSPSDRTISMTTVDRAVKEHGLPPPYLLKFDTHGFEVPILDGAVKSLASTSLIVMEIYNFQLNGSSLRFHQMCAHIEKLGFRCCDLVDPMLRERDQAFWQADMFFLKSDSSLFECESYR